MPISCWKHGGSNQGTFCLFLQDTGLKSKKSLGLPLDPDHYMAKDFGTSFVLPVKVFNDKDSFGFLMWVTGGAQ